jgi:drug/metabolite transporter (DMT)-like permease
VVDEVFTGDGAARLWHNLGCVLSLKEPIIMSRPPAPILELLLLLLLASLWGASYSFIKIGIATIPPITFIAARTAIAGGLLLAVAMARGVRLPRDRANWGAFALQGTLSSALPFTLIAWAEHEVDAGLATILNSSTPVFAFLLTVCITRHEPVTLRKLFGVIAGMGGICLIVGVQALQGLGAELVSQLAIVLATVSYAAAAIYGKRFKSMDPMAPAAGALLCSALLLLPFSMVIDRPWTLAPSHASLMALLALSVFSTAMAFAIYFRLIQTLGSVGTTAQAFLRVPVGVAIGMVFMGDMLPSTAWVGLVAILCGVVAMTMPPRTTTPTHRMSDVPVR